MPVNGTPAPLIETRTFETISCFAGGARSRGPEGRHQSMKVSPALEQPSSHIHSTLVAGLASDPLVDDFLAGNSEKGSSKNPRHIT